MLCIGSDRPVPFKIFSIKLRTSVTFFVKQCVALLVSVCSIMIGFYFSSLSVNQFKLVSNYSTCTQMMCQSNITFPRNLSSPIYLYYELDNFIANTRQYLLQVSYPQLSGTVITASQASLHCTNYQSNGQLKKYKSYTGVPLNSHAIASPCGLQAKLYFTDTFNILYEGKQMIINQSITQNSRFKKSVNSTNTQWIDPTNTSFEIWMSTGPSHKVIKLYGILQGDILENRVYTLQITNQANYSDYCPNLIKSLRFVKRNNIYGSTKTFGNIFLVAGVVLFTIQILRIYVHSSVGRKTQQYDHQTQE